jgi:hypothetical protein
MVLLFYGICLSACERMFTRNNEKQAVYCHTGYGRRSNVNVCVDLLESVKCESWGILIFVWLCIVNVNKVGDQLDASLTVYWYSDSINMFRALLPIFSCVLQHVVFYTQVVASGQQQLGCKKPQAVKHSLELLKMDRSSQNMLS